ncbi:SDR family NAD(P)-dependent oxidoreductase [Methylorubrum sp. Q1]|uniref:SDR family oxidoreductase n=1 Tax=Methylorubrum sp. Q1 TaxID=2562453 RepID=UPI001075EEA7|nr:SDR family oxidoreductase [Methylorubrum sp. Q1]TFZ58324.1 SDR family NAD(P)-dependent oxidoreductase [Methylorubrum sp. Q1]
MILVVGGAGAFGARLVAGLAATTDLRVIVAGRDVAKAEVVARTLPDGRGRAARLDATEADAAQLRALGATVVVDAAGPFQGGAPVLARAAIEAGLPYLDLADGRDFVAAFPRLDAAAQGKGVVALTGASSTPALSNAALDALTAGWRTVETVRVAIVPGNRAPRGLSVMRAILSYAGQPVRVLRAGTWQNRPGWGLLGRIAVPGLGRRFASLCETPDLDILPARFPALRTALFRAGLELPLLHLGLSLASLPVRWRLLPSLVPLARPFLAIAGWLDRFGSDRGGMSVEVLGTDATGRPVRAVWSLVAEAGDGPYVPTLPALAAIRRLTDPSAAAIPPGARPCVGVLPLAAIEAEMARLSIRTRCDTDHPVPLFERVLGDGFARMPDAVRLLHGAVGDGAFCGRAAVVRGRGPLVALVAGLFRLPPALEDGPIRVTMEPDLDAGSERWTRHFPSRRFSSRMRRAGPDGSGRVRERFGPFAMDLAVRAHADGLDMAVTGWRLGPLSLPRFLRPTTQASERVDAQGRFRFDVALFLPFLGLLVHYRGWLVRCDEREEETP